MSTPAARRMRRLRERRARGARVVLVEVDVDLLEALDEIGLVDSDEAGDPGALAFALLMLLTEAVDARRRHFEENLLRVTRGQGAAVEWRD